MIDILAAVLLILGAGFAMIAGIGIVRMKDVYIRMHAATKAGTLGAGLILAGVAFYFGELVVILTALLAILFLLITAPVAAHMIGRAAYRTGVPLCKESVIDEWRSTGSSSPSKIDH